MLIVDDDPSTCELYTTLLVYEGYEVECARDGLDALEQLKCEPDLIVLDLSMPRIDGYEFLRRLVRLPTYAHIPVLVVSAYPRLTMPRGATAMMSKPFDSNALLTQISEMLAVAI